MPDVLNDFETGENVDALLWRRRKGYVFDGRVQVGQPSRLHEARVCPLMLLCYGNHLGCRVNRRDRLGLWMSRCRLCEDTTPTANVKVS